MYSEDSCVIDLPYCICKGYKEYCMYGALQYLGETVLK